jgi:hypothetical protein
VTEPVLKTVAKNGGVCFSHSFVIFGNAFTKTCAIVATSMFPAVSTKARTLAFIRASRSMARNRMRSSFVSTIQPFPPTAAQPVLIGCVGSKMIIMDSTLAPALRRASATVFFPRERSKNSVGDSGGFGLELAADRFFDFIGGEFVIVCQSFDGIAGLISFGEN